MSDRTQGSVRTESSSGDGAASTGAASGATPPATATQSIPATGSQRAQGSAGGGTPTAPAGAGTSTASAGASTSTASAGAGTSIASAGGSTSTGPTSGGAVAPSAPAAPPTTGPVGAPPVPPSTGSSPAVTPASGTGAGTAAAAATGERASRGRGPSRPGGRGPRRARLQLRHIDTWSALKISLVLSIALFFIWMVAVGILYGVLSGLGVFDTVNDLFGQIGSASGSKSSGDVVTFGVVFWGAAVIGAINIVLMTALCTVGTFIYNLCSDLVGGLELTLSERD
jgi:hypothetical protein